MKGRLEQSDSVETPTPRERELIALIALGLQNKAIAHQLRISPHTVRAHIGNIMRKYRLRNRTQIAVILTSKASASGSHDHDGSPEQDALALE
jgi:DNA-binding NarL/FixJ family response regulator